MSRIARAKETQSKMHSHPCKQHGDVRNHHVRNIPAGLQLCRTLGNQAMLYLSNTAIIQRKLIVGKSNDKYEQEADRISDMLMRMPDPSQQARIQRKEDKKEKVPAKRLVDIITPVVQQYTITAPEALFIIPETEKGIRSLNGNGRPLSKRERDFFEPRFGVDFSNVRIHTGGVAAKTTKDLNAHAYTVGNDVVMGDGKYSPGSESGKKLLGHELVHAVQQSKSKKLNHGILTTFTEEKNKELILFESPCFIQRDNKEQSLKPETQIAAMVAEKERSVIGEGMAYLPPSVKFAYLGTNFGIGFLSGLVSAFPQKVSDRGWQNFIKGFSDIINILDFHGGIYEGIPYGFANGIYDNIEGFYELGSLVLTAVREMPIEYMLALLNPTVGIPKLLGELLYNYFTSTPEEQQSLNEIAKEIIDAISKICIYLHNNPNALIVEGEYLGKAVGEFAGEWFENMVIQEPIYRWKGVAIGDFIGRIALEVVLLFFAPETEVIKGVATGAKTAARAIKTSRFANCVVKIVDQIPGLKKLMNIFRDLIKASSKIKPPLLSKLDEGLPKVGTKPAPGEKKVSREVYKLQEKAKRIPNAKEEGGKLVHKQSNRELLTDEFGIIRYKDKGTICRTCNPHFFELKNGSWRLRPGKRIPKKKGTSSLDPSSPSRTGHVHDRPAFEEQHVGFARYRFEKGWYYIDGPSGKGGHSLTAYGIDGVAYNIRDGVLEIVEQKGISRARPIGLKDKPTAVTKNFAKNLDIVIDKVSTMTDLPDQEKVLDLLKKTRNAIDGKGTVPDNVLIRITSERGTGITKGLREYWEKRGVNLPIEFGSTAVK